MQEVSVSPEGNIVASVVESLRSRLRESIAEDTCYLTLDMACVEEIDSMGIGLLIATHNTLVKKGGRLNLINVNSNISRLFKYMRLDVYFLIKS